MLDVPYTVRRSKTRRTLTISVERDRRVIIHAPAGASDEAIRKAVDSKQQWILEKTRHPQKYQELPHPPGKELVSGESALYLGRQYRIEVVKGGVEGVRFANGFLVPASHASKRKEALLDWYVARANEKVLPRVAQYARSLGVQFRKAKIVDNRYRWGSCTVKNCVTFNWRLIKAPVFVIDYVIVHELTHLLETNHTRQFWGVVRAHVPHMEKARAWLRDHGQTLEEEV